jgi:hypothetical protein
MRKLIGIVLIAVLCVVMSAGCSTDYEYATNLTSTSNSMDVKLSVDPIWTQEIPEAPEEYTIEFQGSTYTGTYRLSTDAYLCSFASHQYWGDTCSFRVRANTGELVSFSFLVSGFSKQEVVKQDVPDPEKTAYEIAEQTASEYIDTSKYTRSISSDVTHAEVGGKTLEYTTYSVIYTKEIGGISTDDTLRVYVTSKGTLKGVFFGEIGAFDHIRQTDISLKKVEDSVADKLLELEQKAGKNLSDDYEIEEHTIHLTPNKEVAVVSLVNVWWETPDGDASRDLLQMTTLLQ